MSASFVRQALEMFNDDLNGEEEMKKGKKNKSDNVDVISVRKIGHKKRKKKPQKSNFVKASTNAFDEQWRYAAVDRTQSNLQVFKEQELFHAADAKAVDMIVQHQKGKLAKFHTSKSDTKESATSLFSDRDFDRFEKEYVF